MRVLFEEDLGKRMSKTFTIWPCKFCSKVAAQPGSPLCHFCECESVPEEPCLPVPNTTSRDFKVLSHAYDVNQYPLTTFYRWVTGVSLENASLQKLHSQLELGMKRKGQISQPCG